MSDLTPAVYVTPAVYAIDAVKALPVFQQAQGASGARR